jgi:hypothetical protein
VGLGERVCLAARFFVYSLKLRLPNLRPMVNEFEHTPFSFS